MRLLVDESFTPAIMYSTSTSIHLERILEEFHASHENVEIILEEIPEDLDERELFLDRLGVEIMAGKGPDIYLLSSNSDASVFFGGMQPLFPDVNQTMRNGLFADLSAYYDADMELKTEGLNSTIMDAGVVDGYRFTLPLRFEYPVAYVNVDAFETAGLSTDIFDGGVTEVMDALVQHGDAHIAASASFIPCHYALSFFPELLDYNNQKVLLTEAELTDFIDSWIPYHSLKTTAESQMVGQTNITYYAINDTWMQNGQCINVDSIGNALYQAAIAKALDIELEMYPLTGPEGKVVAEILTYAAVGSSCDDPELAYEFVRMLLTEESQWESNISQHMADYGIADDNMIYPGYCSRIENSVQVYYQNLYLRVTCDDDPREIGVDKERKDRLAAVKLTNADVPILQTEIDVARYPLTEMEWSFANSIFFSNYRPLEEDFDAKAAAQSLIQEMEWHLLEG